jgi:hypothetical protein
MHLAFRTGGEEEPHWRFGVEEKGKYGMGKGDFYECQVQAYVALETRPGMDNATTATSQLRSHTNSRTDMASLYHITGGCHLRVG